MNVLSLLEALLSIDPDQRGSAARALESEVRVNLWLMLF